MKIMNLKATLNKTKLNSGENIITKAGTIPIVKPYSTSKKFVLISLTAALIPTYQS